MRVPIIGNSPLRVSFQRQSFGNVAERCQTRLVMKVGRGAAARTHEPPPFIASSRAQYAYACCKANRGTAGVDAERFEDIEAYSLKQWPGELAQELRNMTYEPRAVRRVFIPKQSVSGLHPKHACLPGPP
jgi:hypothetical protein